MSTPEPKTFIVKQVHVNKLNTDTGDIEPGWELTVRDHVTGVAIPVFVPDNVYSPENVKLYVQDALNRVRAVHSIDL